MSNVTLCIPTLNRYDLLTKCITSSLISSSIPKKVSIIDNGNAMPNSIHSYLKTVCESANVELTIFTPAENLGVAKSWNWFMDIEEDPMLICNDDIEFGKEDIKSFEDAFYSSNALLYYTTNTSPLNMFSCFMPTAELIEKVGKFDDNFYPAYFEDNDYFYRIKLQNISYAAISTNISHFGSATIRQYDDEQMIKHHETFRKNKLYYIQKWGGAPNNETFNTPFGSIANGNL